MGRKSVAHLTEYLLSQAGDGLRTVVILTGDGYETKYLRPDLQEDYTEEAFARVVETFRTERSETPPDIDGSSIGERRAVVNYHENAFVLQFPVADAESVLISLTADAGRDLLAFIETCQKITRADGQDGQTA